jgi:hypothetical protein
VGLGDEFLIAAVGPLTSLLVAALFWIVNVFARGALPRSLIGMFGYLAWVNLLLAAFNLIPGFPLDGCCARWCGGPPAASARPPGSPRWPARRWDGCWWPAAWPFSWPGIWPGASGSRSSAGSWSRPPGPPTKSTVLESVPPRRLTMTFDAPGEAPPGGPSKVTFDIEPYHEIVRLTVTHENLADSDAAEAVSAGWPAVCANLKSLLETGHVLPRAPWEMHAELRAAQMARNDPRPSGS